MSPDFIIFCRTHCIPHKASNVATEFWRANLCRFLPLILQENNKAGARKEFSSFCDVGHTTPTASGASSQLDLEPSSSKGSAAPQTLSAGSEGCSSSIGEVSSPAFVAAFQSGSLCENGLLLVAHNKGPSGILSMSRHVSGLERPYFILTVSNNGLAWTGAKAGDEE